MPETNTQQGVGEETDESGSTIIGIISVLVALFFLYAGIQRVWWSLSLEVQEYLVFGLLYVLIGVIAVGGSVYGLISKKRGARVLVVGLLLTGAGSFALASYYWFTGMVMDGTVSDVFNAVTLSVFGIGYFVVGFTAGWIFERIGIDYSESDTDPDEMAEKIEQRGDDIADNIEQFGEDLDEKVTGTTDRILSAIPWSKLVIAGMLLWVAVFPLVNYENAVAVVLLLGWITVPVAIYFDSKPVRRTTEGRTWWWLFVLGSLIPFFAVLSGLGWLVWKRRLV